MKNFKRAQALMFTLLMAQSPATLASYYRSNIEGIDISGAYRSSIALGDIQKKECGKYAPDQSEDDRFYEDQCEEGVLAAHKMAEIYAKGEGEYLGCFDGFQQGLHIGFRSNNRPSADQLAQERAYLAGTEIKEAVAAGNTKASQDSRYSSESEVIARFRDNVRKTPSAQVKAPSDDYSDVLNVPAFEGFSNGYATQGLGGSFSGPINAGWISSSASLNDRITARAAYAERLSITDICSPGPVLFNNGLSRVSFWDIFSAYGEYNFKDYGYKSTNRAWNKFSCESDSANSACETLPESRTYQNIQPRTERVTVQTGTEDDLTKPIYKEVQAKDPVTGELVFNADGSPKMILALDANGKPIVTGYEQRPTYGTETRVIAGYSKAQLQEKFEEGFRKAYQQLVRDYFGHAFVKAHSTQRKTGEIAGKAIGAKVAQDIAKQEAYDAKYKLDSATAFAREYERLFVLDWQKNFDLFVNNPVVELVGMEVVGKDSDDIYRRGEFIRPILTLRNLGLEDGKVKINLEGSGVNSSSAVSDSKVAPASLIFDYDTDKFLAKISPDATVRQRTTVVARVDAPGTSSVLQLKDTDSKQILINEIAEIDGKREEIFTTKGEGTVFVDVVNPATVEAGTIDVEVSLDNGASFTESMILGKAQNGKPAVKSNFPVRISGIDPLRFIKDGGFSGIVSTKLPTGVELHAQRISISIDRNKETAKYFHQVINGETSNFGNQSQESRTEALIGKIISETQKDISREVDWDREVEYRNTLLGRLVVVYRSAKINNNVSESAQLKYDELARQLEAIYDRVGDYEGYMKLLNELSSVELEERGKKDRK